MQLNKVIALLFFTWSVNANAETLFSSGIDQTVSMTLLTSVFIGRHWFDSTRYGDLVFSHEKNQVTVNSERSHNLEITWQQPQRITLCSQHTFMMYALADEQPGNARVELLPFASESGYCAQVFLDSPAGFFRFLFDGVDGSVDPDTSVFTLNGRDIPLRDLSVNVAPDLCLTDIEPADVNPALPRLQLGFSPDLWTGQNGTGSKLMILDSWQYKVRQRGGGKGGTKKEGGNGEQGEQHSSDGGTPQGGGDHQGGGGGAAAGGDGGPPRKPGNQNGKNEVNYTAAEAAKKLQLLKALLQKGKVTTFNLRSILEQFKRILNELSAHDINIEFQDGSGLLHDVIDNIPPENQNIIVELVDILLNYGANANAVNNTGNTPFHLAASHGMVSVLETLLAHSTSHPSYLEDANTSQQTPLMLAAMNGHDYVVTLLINQGVNLLQADSDGYNALHLAALNGHAQIVNLLLLSQTPDSINCQTALGESALYLAARGGHVEVIHVLLNNNADINLQNLSGETPVAVALRENKVAAVIALLNRGATLTIPSDIASTFWKGIIANPEMFDVVLSWSNDHPEALTNKEDRNYSEGITYSVLHGNLLLNAVYETNTKIATIVLDKGMPDINIPFNVHNKNTSLHWAAQGRSETMVKLLLRHNPDLEALNAVNETPFTLVAKSLKKCASDHMSVNWASLPSDSISDYLKVLEPMIDAGACVADGQFQGNKKALQRLCATSGIDRKTRNLLKGKNLAAIKKKQEEAKAKAKAKAKAEAEAKEKEQYEKKFMESEL